jgi:iron-sulfur cluster assembly protein
MLTLTETAHNKIKNHLTKRGKGLGIRVGVKTTGCSGLAYVLEYVDEVLETDVVYSQQDFSVYVDPKHLVYLSDITLDYQRKGLNEGFEFINPLEKDRCGCGESFRI